MRALVLCGGFGTRLGALCENCPKPLLEVGNEAIVEHTLSRMARQGLSQIFINVHFRAEQVVERLGNGARYGVAIQYLHESTLLGTAGTARALYDRCDGADLLVHYGDVLSEHNLSDLVEHHREQRAKATIVVHEREGSNSRAVLGDSDRVERFLERPTLSAASEIRTHWTFSGICVLSSSCLAELPTLPGADLPRDVFPDVALAGGLYAHRHSGYRCAVDSPARLASAREAWKNGTMLARRQPEAT